MLGRPVRQEPASAGLGAFKFNFGYAYSYATGGKWNYCQALIEGAIGAGIGLLFL